MPRNMSFKLTTEQVRNRTKTVTRRTGWKNLTPGTILNAVVQAQGLRKGQKVEVICQIRIDSNTPECLQTLIGHPEYGAEECIKEGFPEMTPREFVNLFLRTHRCFSDYDKVNRIAFSYL